MILPAALPGYVGGLKQGWAFAWRSLMAGEIIGIVSTRSRWVSSFSSRTTSPTPSSCSR